GVIGADLLVAAVATQSLASLAFVRQHEHLLYLVGGAFFLGLGLFGWRAVQMSASPRQSVEGIADGFRNQFVIGSLMCLLNPGFFAFWAFASGLAFTTADVELGTAVLVTFLAGIFLG